MISTCRSLGVFGSGVFPVTVEVDVAGGLPGISVVGLPDAAVREMRDRLGPAIKNAGFSLPGRRVTINLAPAEIKKEGPALDLPAAIGLLASSGVEIPPEALASHYLLGELSLGGQVRRVRGVLPMAVHARGGRLTRLVVPRENAAEAAVVDGLSVYPVSTLAEAVAFLRGEADIKPWPSNRPAAAEALDDYEIDFSEVRGQEFAKRVLEVAVAGNHNILFIGPPGSGKTMLARRVPTILPALTLEEALETSQVYSLAGLLPESGLVTVRPFRAPHHTISDIALVGGGSHPRPGEVSLAHNGVLFLDEMPEFNRRTLEVLRQPLEEGAVHISRARASVTFSSRFILVAAMNPCPCGNLGHPRKACRCNAAAIGKYRARLSGPLLDRIDMHIEVPPVPVSELAAERSAAESSAAIRARVEKARSVQAGRYRSLAVRDNAGLSGRQIAEYCRLAPEAADLLRAAVERFDLSARSYDRLRRVARTVADLEESGTIEAHHVAETLQYRALDRKVWL